MFPSLTARYRAMPRSMRWGMIFLLVLTAYFAVIEPAVNWSVGQRVQAERLEKSLEARNRLANSNDGGEKELERAIVAHGSPKPPRANLPDPLGFLSQKTADMAQKHGITVKRRTRRSNTPVQGVEWNGARVERASIELVVECDTERFMALLKDLESSPDITQVSSVRMNKLSEPGVSLADSTLMQITLTPEVWVIAGSAAGAVAAPRDEPPPDISTDPSINPDGGAATPTLSPASAPSPGGAP